MKKHHFVLCGEGQLSGWWLKITSPEELADYHDAHSGRYGKAFKNILQGKEYGAPSVSHGPNVRELPLSDAIFYHAMNKKISVVESTMDISSTVMNAQMKALLEQGHIFVNCMGGWCWNLPSAVRQFIDKDDFVFPNFGTKDIRISKFPGGQHYYAYIGAMQVRDGDTLKWNTREEAYAQALRCLPEE